MPLKQAPPPLAPNALDILKKRDIDLAFSLRPERTQALLLEFLDSGEFISATEREVRVLLCDPEVMEFCRQVKENEAHLKLLTTGNKVLTTILEGPDSELAMKAYDRLRQRAEKAPLVNLNFNLPGAPRSHEEMLKDIEPNKK